MIADGWTERVGVVGPKRAKWISGQALEWPVLSVVTIRPTVFLEGFFLPLTSPSGRDQGRLGGPELSLSTSPDHR